MSFLKLAQKCVPGRTCPGHIQDMSRTCTRNVPVLTIFGHLQKCPESICPMSFLNFSNLSYVLSQIYLKMCPRPDMSRTRPGRVLNVSSKCPCPDHFGTSPNRTSATKWRSSTYLYGPPLFFAFLHYYLWCTDSDNIPQHNLFITLSYVKVISEIRVASIFFVAFIVPMCLVGRKDTQAISSRLGREFYARCSRLNVHYVYWNPGQWR